MGETKRSKNIKRWALRKVNKDEYWLIKNKKEGEAMEKQVKGSQGRERVYDSVIALRVSQAMAQALREKAKEYGLNVSDFLRLKLIEILRHEDSR
jgi:hypothetical protein